MNKEEVGGQTMFRVGTILLVIVGAILCQVSGLAEEVSGPAEEEAEFDLLIKGGHLIDPKNAINTQMDIAVDDEKIAEVAEDIASDRADRVIDARGLYVTPGLIDMHTHIFWGTRQGSSHFHIPERGDYWWSYSNSYASVQPDAFSFRAGVTTVVDAGGAGWRNFKEFKEQTVKYSWTRVLAFLNIVGGGMDGGPVEQNLADMDARLTALFAEEHSDIVVGIKLAHYRGPNWEPTRRTVEAGRLAKLPVMIDFGYSMPKLPLSELLTNHLRPGDIFTHCYADQEERQGIVNEEGVLPAFALEAQQRGLIFDVGHGAGSFAFSQAIPAIRQGLWPNTISTDLHAWSMNGGLKNMTNLMSKFLSMGMPLEEVVRATTSSTAKAIKREELGHLSVGAEADVAVFRLLEGNFGFVDASDKRIEGTQKLIAELTLRRGWVAWDLNGLSAQPWDK